MRCLWLALLCLAAAWGPGAARAQDVLPVPVLTSRLIDSTGTLRPEQRSVIEGKLEALEREVGAQVVVYMLASTQPEDIGAFAQRVADVWRIGRRDVGDGVLIVVAQQDRKVRIEVAKTLEGAIPDLAARQIIERQIGPAFKQADFVGGLNAGIDALGARIRGEGLAAPSTRASRDSAGGFDFSQLAMFFFIGVPVLGAMLRTMLGRKGGAMASAAGAGALATWFGAGPLVAAGLGLAALLMVALTGRSASSSNSRSGGLFPGVFSGGGSSWGGSSSSGGGGGFSSGGGGDFGGGGASGDW